MVVPQNEFEKLKNQIQHGRSGGHLHCRKPPMSVSGFDPRTNNTAAFGEDLVSCTARLVSSKLCTGQTTRISGFTSLGTPEMSQNFKASTANCQIPAEILVMGICKSCDGNLQNSAYLDPNRQPWRADHAIFECDK